MRLVRHHASNSAEGPQFETLEHIPADRYDIVERLSVRQDLGQAWVRLKQDTAAVLQPGNLLILAAAAGGAIAIHQDLDDDVREHTARHPKRWDEATEFLGEVGEVYVQAPVIAGMYLLSVRQQNEDLHDFTTTLASAFAINGLSTVLLKVAVNTDRPSDSFNNGRFGFPSYHTSSSFTIAGVLDEYYGWEVGLPAYALAGLIGWSRIDERDHDLSDVVFGAALGYVIGKAVARHNLAGDSRLLLLPWTEPANHAVGVQWQWSY